MKKILFASFLVILGFTTVAAGRDPNEKLVQAFREAYPNAVQVSWVEYPESYIVYFQLEAVKANIIFGKEGTFIRATRYYKEEYLPYYLVAAIQEKYPSKKIYGVTEVSTTAMIAYFIKLEDAKTWTTIQVDSEGNIKVLEKLKKI
jgi:ABC-type glycerol-3-phosphate transport system substrate-binding protein